MSRHLLLCVMGLLCWLYGAAQAATAVELLAQTEHALRQGQVHQAIASLEAARFTDDPASEAKRLALLGEAYMRAQRLDAAAEALRDAARHVASDAPALASDIALRQGQLALARREPTQAEAAFRQALQHAEQAHDTARQAAVRLNWAQATKDFARRCAQLAATRDLLVAHRNVPYADQLAAHLGHQALLNGDIALAYSALRSVALHSADSRLRAEAFGHLAELYETNDRPEDALRLLERALATDASPDLMLRAEWQRGRLLAAQRHTEAALTAYRNALGHLQRIRLDMPVVYQDGRSSFRDTLAPLYTDLIELLLQQADRSDVTTQQNLLHEAQNAWEDLKAAELQDYFRDACAVRTRPQQEWPQIEPGTALIYPMLLSHRLHLVVGFSDGLTHYPIPVTSRDVSTLVERLKRKLIANQPITEHQQLYQWLLAPLHGALQQHQVATLIYLPDGALRQVPLSLLHDGEHYVVERYAVVTVPGLSMLPPRTAKRTQRNILLAGMSQPGPVVEELLDEGVELFDIPDDNATGPRGLNRSLRALPLRQAGTDDGTRDALRAARELRANRLKEVLQLPGVTQELHNLAALTGAPFLENQDFNLQQFETQVKRGYSAVHIATHGFFSGDPEKSFVMTYDHLLKMHQLATLFQSEAFAENPVELITLSACQTAEGDERSPLGLSGVVVQAGVRSAIGTLWPVADEAAQQLFSDFYRLYRETSHSKAEALRQAQLKLLQNEKLAYPFYWAPFVLIGDGW